MGVACMNIGFGVLSDEPLTDLHVPTTSHVGVFSCLLVRESDSLGRLLDVYVAQAHYYWQEPDVLVWLERNIEAVLLLVEPIVLSPNDQASTIASTVKNQAPDSRLQEYSAK